MEKRQSLRGQHQWKVTKKTLNIKGLVTMRLGSYVYSQVVWRGGIINNFLDYRLIE